ncbi:MAG: M28 family peptidase, partial [Acidobacteriota bacterium]
MLNPPRSGTFLLFALQTILALSLLQAQSASPPLLPEPAIAALAEELSGENAHRIVQQLTQWHRMRGSEGFAAATGHIRQKLEEYGLQGVEVWSFPADGEVFYGTQRSRPAWDAEFAELWELRQAKDGSWQPEKRIASWEARPISLAQDSASGSADDALLIDVGAGTKLEDYRGKSIQGSLVLTSSQPSAVSELAVDAFGAAGVVSYAQNQRSAWWKQDEDLVRWGHWNTFPPPTAFAFMVSLKQARSWQERLASGQEIRLDAEVRAGQHPGSYDIVTAVIPGSDPQLREQEIVFSCHLDHQRPGANDNASGCATILEVARSLSKLIREGKIPPPLRSLRFVWPPEIEGTLALLNGRSGWAGKVLAAIHLDMVGGGPVTKAEFHITRSPQSLPTFINDVAEAFGDFVNRQTALYADTGQAPYPFASPEGGREALKAAMADLTLGSDHQVYSEGSFRIPAIYLNDWPDRYIHTHADRLANIDPTRLLRSAFVAGASGYFLARMDASSAEIVAALLQRHALRRTAVLLERIEEVPALEKANLVRFHFEFQLAKLSSLSR